MKTTKMTLKVTKNCSFVKPVSPFLAVFGTFMSFQYYSYHAFTEDMKKIFTVPVVKYEKYIM